MGLRRVGVLVAAAAVAAADGAAAAGYMYIVSRRSKTQIFGTLFGEAPPSVTEGACRVFMGTANPFYLYAARLPGTKPAQKLGCGRAVSGRYVPLVRKNSFVTTDPLWATWDFESQYRMTSSLEWNLYHWFLLGDSDWKDTVQRHFRAPGTELQPHIQA
jgi:hypothetical protein